MDSRRKSACNSLFVCWRLGEGRARAARARRGANRGRPIRPKPGETGRQSTVIACLQARVRIRQKIWYNKTETFRSSVLNLLTLNSGGISHRFTSISKSESSGSGRRVFAPRHT